MNKLLAFIALAAVFAAPVQAGPATAGAGGTISPLIQAGDPNGVPPDSPGNRVDPNLPSSPFAGVVSINIRYNGLSFICSGALVDPLHVVTAGHCVDTTGNGNVIDVSQPFGVSGRDVRVVFNSQPNPGDPGRAIVTASAVSMNPNYQGFGNCPAIANHDGNFCVNDDVAVITMSAPAPVTAKTYRVYSGAAVDGQRVTMVGYGTSGDGVSGFYVGPDFRIKRSGGNFADLYDLDDEQDFAAGPREVWYADFDGNGQDTFCAFFAACSPQLANNVESALGGGDSGGPSFINVGGEWMIWGNDTFGGTFAGQTQGTFGTYFGGIVLSAYQDYLVGATGGAIQFAAPVPATLALMLVGLLGFGVARRRS